MSRRSVYDRAPLHMPGNALEKLCAEVSERIRHQRVSIHCGGEWPGPEVLEPIRINIADRLEVDMDSTYVEVLAEIRKRFDQLGESLKAASGAVCMMIGELEGGEE